MPRTRGLTITRRSNCRNTGNPYNDNVETNNVSQNIVLIDFFKCALIVVPRNFESVNLGDMILRCSLCNALHFSNEITSNDRTKFSLCCHKGKVVLPPLTPSQFFQSLIEGVSSQNRAIKNRSKKFLNNIRSYNSAFAMASSEAQLDESVFNGVFHFKIHDAFYHRVGGLVPADGCNPRYAQLYFYDVETAVQYRMRERANVECDVNIMRELAVHLQTVNPFIRSFKTMSEISQNYECPEVCMYITLDRLNDQRRFNDAIQTDVATIFISEDGTPPIDRNMVIFSKNSNEVRHISTLNSSLDPLAYPILFPNGDFGWHPNIFQSNNNGRKVTMLQYASYRLAIRSNTFSFLHRSQKLFLQWVVDMYVRIEGARLQFVRCNQSTLRSDLYSNLTDFFYRRLNDINNNVRIGRQVILPSSFIGSPRNMHQNYLDAMSIVQKCGKPSLFITMTCNPSWPEIKNNIAPSESSNFRPDIVVRVFHSKLKSLMDSIIKKQIFGKVQALIYTIEFQKRGLPHAHILLTLHVNDRIHTIEDIDKVVSAQIPDCNSNPKLHDLVKKHMIHGPCGILNPNSVCMENGKCKKQFPKNFCERTRDDVNGYPQYKRCDNGVSVEVRGQALNNSFVVPYNPYLLAKFDCHLNVEVCTTVKSVKYIYKYVHKGYDSAVVRFSRVNDNVENVAYDEIDSFLNGRYVGSTEAVWRIFEYEMHYQTHTNVRLDCHLPNRQSVYFRDGNEQQIVDNPPRTKLLAFFQLNRQNPSANNLLYTEVPEKYVWNERLKMWTERMRASNNVISRLYAVSIKNVELFHLRLLLLHVSGAISFEHLRTYNNIVYNTFYEAAYARGIATNDNEWRDCLNEAKEVQSPFQLRQLFGFICGLNVPSNALLLWSEFKYFLSEDFLRNFNEDISFNKTLIQIEEILVTHNITCLDLGLPSPNSNYNQVINPQFQQQNCDPIAEELLFDEMYRSANNDQRNIIDKVLQEIQFHNTGSNVFCLTAYAGCGKTFIQNAIIHKLNSLQLQCIPCAYSGIASTLLPGGRTLHNIFKIPIPVLETSTSSITVNSSAAHKINNASLIIIDEISMCPLLVLKLIDKLLRDIGTNGNRNKIFGGKPILMCGDFRQTLPVIPHASPSILMQNCITAWSEYHLIHKFTLTRNMRALESEIEFAEFLKLLGDGNIQSFPQLGHNDIIEIPNHLICTDSIINDIYGNIADTIHTPEILQRVILAPKNDDCTLINNHILNILPGEEHIFNSCDIIVTDDDRERNNVPIEFINSLSLSGLPPHKLVLKANCIVLLIRNLNTGNALVNGTRMRVKRMYRNSIDCEILTGVSSGQRILIPRIHLTYSGTLLPFTIRRTQFPIIPAFAITINKSQGQTFDKVGILLPQPVFSHGQLYVAASRVRTFDSLCFHISECPGQGHLMNNERVFTKNIVYKNLLR